MGSIPESMNTGNTTPLKLPHQLFSALPMKFTVTSEKENNLETMEENAIETNINVSWHVCKESRICNPRDKIAALFAELQNRGDKKMSLTTTERHNP